MALCSKMWHMGFKDWMRCQNMIARVVGRMEEWEKRRQRHTKYGGRICVDGGWDRVVDLQ